MPNVQVPARPGPASDGPGRPRKLGGGIDFEP
jgi:hypothetical protein